MTATHAEPRTAAEAHHRLAEALLASDEPTLRRLVADDCQIIGPKGFQLSKDGWIGPHTADLYDLESLEVLESIRSEHGDTAIVVELQQSACVFHGERIEGLFRVLSVWRNETESWQLAALQYTAVADGAQR